MSSAEMSQAYFNLKISFLHLHLIIGVYLYRRTDVDAKRYTSTSALRVWLINAHLRKWNTRFWYFIGCAMNPQTDSNEGRIWWNRNKYEWKPRDSHAHSLHEHFRQCSIVEALARRDKKLKWVAVQRIDLEICWLQIRETALKWYIMRFIESDDSGKSNKIV